MQTVAVIPKRQFLYIPCLTFGAFFLFAKSGAYAAFLNVSTFGELSKVFLVVNTLVMFGAFGMQLLGHKSLPMYYAQNDTRQIANLLGSSLLIYVCVTLLLGAFATIYFIYESAHELKLTWVTLILSVSQFGILLLLIDIKSRLNFLGNSIVAMIRALALLVFGTLAAWLSHNFYLVLVMETVVNVGLFILVLAGSRTLQSLLSKFRLKDVVAWTGENIGSALKLAALSLSTIVLFSIDKWCGFVVLDNHDYGLYALGLVVLIAFESVQRMVNVAAYPTMSHMIGKSNYSDAYKIAIIAIFVAFCATAMLYYPGILLVDYLIDHWLPKYIPAKELIDVLIIAGVLRMADFFTSYCILCDLEKVLVKYQVIWSAIVIAGIFVIYSLHAFSFTPLSLAWLALVTSALNIVTSILLSVKFNIKQGVALLPYRRHGI